jgi:hypothetical protein
MGRTTANHAAEEAIVRHIAADTGVLDGLIRRGVVRRWFTDPFFTDVISTSIRLRMQGQGVDPLSIMAASSGNVTQEKLMWLVDVWRNPGAPGRWEPFVEPLYQSLLLRDFDKWMADARSYRTKKPDGVQGWLPSLVGSLESIMTGEVYDARASTHYQQDLRTVTGRFGIPHWDRALKGGIWSSALVMVGGISNHGKSTLAYTLAAKCINRQTRVVFVTTETLPSEVVVGVLRPLVGLSDKRVRERDPLCMDAMPQLDRYMPVYGPRYSSIEMLQRVLRWESPAVVILDFLRAPPGSDGRVPEHRIMADMGEGLRTLSNDFRCTIVAFGQFAAATAREFRDKNNLREVTLFGSARLYHAADQVIIMKRHQTEPNTGFFKVKKDRLPTLEVTDNLYDWEFTLRHDRHTHSFFQP